MKLQTVNGKGATIKKEFSREMQRARQAGGVSKGKAHLGDFQMGTQT